MVFKILFTLAVIATVIVVFRHQRTVAARGVHNVAADATGTVAIAPRAVAYGLLVALVGVSLLVFILHMRAENRVIAIRVISDDTVVHYQARRKFIHGRSFTAMNGAQITLGDNDRMEMRE